MSITRRNALVGVLDKPSEFAERAVHEWSAQVFRAEDGPLLSAQFRIMIRTERTKAASARSTTMSRSAVHRRRDRGHRGQYEREGARGAEPRWWEDVAEGDEVGPLVKGPFLVTDIVCWHVGMGMGLYGVKPLRPRRRNRRRVPRFFHRDDLNVPDVMQRSTGTRSSPSGRATRPPSTTAGCGRRGSSTSAPTGWATTPGCGSSTASSASSTTWATRSGCAARSSRSYLADGDRPRSTSTSGREPTGRGHHARPRDDPPAQPRARPRPPARPARRATDLQEALEAISDGSSDDGGCARRVDPGRRRRPAPRSTGPRSATPSTTTVVTLIDAIDAAGPDEAVRAILISTASGDHFCSGSDIVACNTPAPEPRVGGIQRRLPSQAPTGSSRWCAPCRCPSCAPLAADVAGIGFHLAVAADFTIAADDATLWEPFARRGFTPDSGATWLLPAAGRRWPARAAPARSPAQRHRGGGVGASSTGRARRRGGRRPRRRWPSAGVRRDGRVGPRPSGCSTRALARLEAQLADEAFALELSTAARTSARG